MQSLGAKVECKRSVRTLSVQPDGLSCPDVRVMQIEHYMRYAIGIYGWRMLSLTHYQEFHLNAGYLLQDDRAFRSYVGVGPSCILHVSVQRADSNFVLDVFCNTIILLRRMRRLTRLVLLACVLTPRNTSVTIWMCIDERHAALCKSGATI